MSKDLVLAVDNGTQSLKALVFDLAGELVAKETVPIPLYSSPQPGWAEQDAEDFWRALCTALQALWRNPQVDKARIAGMAVTTQRGTVISVDKAGNPLRPAILWLDQRRTHNMPPIGGIWGIPRLPTVTSMLKPMESLWRQYSMTLSRMFPCLNNLCYSKRNCK